MMKKIIAAISTQVIILLVLSNLVVIQPVLAETSVTIYGRGHAHGVGLSMAGVYGMTQAGYNYRQIASFYYPNTAWSTRDDNTVIKAISPIDNKPHTLTIREYLYRLAEEPDTWPREGLRATMIAARTYLWYKLERYGYMTGGQYWRHDINPATRPNIVAAVNDTTNQILTYNGKAIVAAYSASAGGYTARMSEIWGGSDTPYPYLINRESPWDSVFSSTFKWTKALTATSIQKAYPTIGQFRRLAIEERTSSDTPRSRVKYIRIYGTKGSVKDKGWTFKSKLGLKSNYFYLEPWPDNSASPPNDAAILSINATSKAVRPRQPIRIYGRISPAKSDTLVLRYKRGRSGWRTLRTIPVNGSSYSVKVRINTANRYVFSAKIDSSASRSMIVYGRGTPVKLRKNISKPISINANAKVIRPRRPIRIFGRTSSLTKGVLLLRYKRGRSKWKTLKKIPVNGSSYSVKVRINTANRYVFSTRIGSNTSRNMIIYSR